MSGFQAHNPLDAQGARSYTPSTFAPAPPPAQAEPGPQTQPSAPDWDTLLESPASLALLDRWVAQAQAALAAGPAEPTRPPNPP
ncbi:hypothetical protein PSQ40_12970 [Curvibacter sp. HBC61]|uniref:Uncharacterized protein n=1 Tax=Curvibacter cyanobacteriorum TaxID=3026422 RepID=A0ABT5MZL1_9BURK|nr:hypothetical protein [Curvibacter sp. HBC61]MDD0839489.1 hypothetical protein [Curvibacter sp. HBC61]